MELCTLRKELEGSFGLGFFKKDEIFLIFFHQRGDDAEEGPSQITMEMQMEAIASDPVVRGRIESFFMKYFCYGQIKTSGIEGGDVLAGKGPPPEGHGDFWINYIWYRPKVVTVFLPLLVILIPWLIVMHVFKLWWVFPNEGWVAGWNASIIMMFGSFVAGATSEGGGSIAYPAMTLILGIPSSVARDFSLMIQSIGMTAAAFSIFYLELKVEKTALIFSTLGGIGGILLSLGVIAPALPDAYAKMIFVAVFLAFAINLFLLNRERKRKTFLQIKNPTMKTYLTFIVTGFVGGILSGIAGSGIDICTFAVLTLLFRVSEKIATPTSVCLMAANTVVGFIFQWVTGSIVRDTWILWACGCIVVPFGAPLGAFVSSYLHRQVLACFVYFTDVSQFILASAVTPMDVFLGITTGLTLVVAILFFFGLRLLGTRILAERLAEQEGKQFHEVHEITGLPSPTFGEVILESDVSVSRVDLNSSAISMSDIEESSLSSVSVNGEAKVQGEFIEDI